jgi:hypothetical protein
MVKNTWKRLLGNPTLNKDGEGKEVAIWRKAM